MTAAHGTMWYYNPALETCSRAGLAEHQWQRLQSLSRQVWATNAFYRRKWQDAGLRHPDDIRTWSEFERLPFTTKEELVQDQLAHPPFGTNLTFHPDAYVRVHQTSGTTGHPLRWLDTADSYDWCARIWCHALAAAGVGPGDRIFFAFSFGPFIGFWVAHAAARKIGALAITAGGQDSLTRLQAMLKCRPTVFLSTPSYALHLAEVAAEHGVDLASGSVAITLHGGEPGAGIPATKKRIETAWGARTYDQTGATEIGPTGFECVAQAGTHLVESEYIFEVIDPSDGRPVAPGEQGELVVTNLGRPGMPLIRYRTRDLVQLTYDRCACGRNFARMVGGIVGRSDDMITVRGINVFPSAIENIVRQYAPVVEFQIEVHRVKSMADLRLKVELAPAVEGEAGAALLANLQAEIRLRLGLRVDVERVAPGSLPRYQMKARRLVRVQE